MSDSDVGNERNPPITPASGATPPLAEAPVAAAGYDVLGKIEGGGMGDVYRAWHCALNRLVALKWLQDRFMAQSSLIRRFLREARITARLQHPGIPPVYEVGTLPDGRPFLAMKLIQGRTLNEELNEKGPGAGRWLGVFEAICQAVGYAHSQGVIHRDLKLANVMVGAFGEVQVMDWGLAKILPRTSGDACQADEDDPWATAAPGEGEPTPPTATEPTQPGRIMGTPAFMPPEQAIGAVDQIDRRSDVFGLGAILCCLLTGGPPFVALDREATRQMAARAKLDDAFARLDGCGAEPELVTLAKRCLSSEQTERPADAGVLAQEVAELRRQAEERARHAELEKARAAVQADEQRKRRHQLYAAVGVVVAVILIALVVRINRDYHERTDAQKVKREFAELSGRLRETEARTRNAEQVAERARRRYQRVLDAIKTAESWPKWVEKCDRESGAECYDAACAFALCAFASPEKDKLIAKAVTLLARAKSSGYFDDPERLVSFHKDPDFAAVREHPAFAEFVRSLKK